MNSRGAATVPVMALVAVLVLVGAGLVAVGRVVAAHTQATAAADAAALAAAPLTFLDGDPVREAVLYAEANGAHLTACRCALDSTFSARTVVVEVRMGVDLPVFGQVEVRARAAAEFDPMDLLVP